MGSLTKPTECSVLLSSPPWWPPPWQPSSPPLPLSPSESARLRRPPAATSQFLMTELLLTKPIAQPPAQWPGPRSALNFAKTLSFTMGDASADVFTADVSLTLTKAKNKAPSAVKTSIDSITTSPLAADPEFYPASLWCPQEDYLIWGQGAFESVVDEAAATGYEECAQRCAEFTNEAGNSPCFSWTMNSNAGEALGLSGGNCRLLAYMNVSGIAFPGVQSGFHKCWNAAQTLNP